ncbi:Short-chain dehydrogenase TIC 32 [Cladobotryum mycophilum]|uniref:Short-chain dehydrogenase TIC 32 n=1 Tax=Cladobotryum mycophilum TaxID=491253 RepID=A0ABR0SJ09_9HYPO
MAFNASSTATEVAQALSKAIRGRTVLITGVSPNSIGAATAFAIASQQPERLILASRTKKNIDAVVADIKSSFPSASIDELLLDLSSLKSVRAAAANLNTRITKLDILINNAGIMALPTRQLSEDGIEMQFATNHVGHFLFTNLILDTLRTAARENGPGQTRIINISSNGHRFSPVRFDDVNFDGVPVPSEQQPDVETLTKRIGKIDWQDGYEKFVSYGQSKTANILFSLYLREQLAKSGVLSFSVHPGTIVTNLIRNMVGSTVSASPIQFVMKSGTLTGRYKTFDGGAATSIYAAFENSLHGNTGIYLEDCGVGTPAVHATKMEDAERLWKLSELLVGEEFPIHKDISE